MNRVNTVRFSFVSKEAKEESGKNTPSRSGRFDTDQAREALQSKDDLNAMEATDAEYVALLRGSQNVFVHMQYLSGTAIVHDASGRQRILHMDEVAQLFLQLKDELSSATTWSRTLTMRMRGDSFLKQGNLKGAIIEYLDALGLLHDTPGLDVDKLARAAFMHGLGQAYRGLKMTMESQACLVESLALYKRSLGREHPRNFEVLHDLGILFEKDGCASEAAALHERSFAGRLKSLGHNAPETLNSMQDLASAKIHLGDLESALLLLEKAVPALDTVFGIQNGTTLSAMNKLSLLYQKLGLNKESRTICTRTIPHCRTFFGVFHPITREAVVRYIQCLENFDFPTDIKDVLEQYRRSRIPDALKVTHRLGRAYMDAGLNRDAADLFEALVDDCMAVKGPEAPETFDALSALCVSREHLDSIEKAVHAYRQLVHMARRTPENHHSRRRIGYAEKRISELNRRRELLAAERKDWGLGEPAPCRQCGSPTRIICNGISLLAPCILCCKTPDGWILTDTACKITRFCSEACHAQGIEAHISSCIPSVSLHESKSLNVRPRCPPAAQDQALLNIQCPDPADINVLATYTYHLDPRNFTTFRMKLSSTANTFVLFSPDFDVQYALLDSGRPSSSSVTKDGCIPEEPNPDETGKHIKPFQWTSPTATDTPCISSKPSPAQSRYLLVTPGRDMLNAMIDRRVNVRSGGGDSERFRSLNVPSMELIEYAQGLMLTGYLGEAFMYVVEWECK